MDDTSAGAATIETPEDLGTDEEAKHSYWMMQDKLAEKEERKWTERGREIVKRYRDDRGGGPDASTRFNILWSNVQTLAPALYARSPKADVERRYKDQDDVGRMAAIILERCLDYSMDAYDFDGVMNPCIEDLLLPGRGIARILYIPHYGEPITAPGETAVEGGSVGEVVANEGDEGPDAPLPPNTARPGEREVVFEEVRAKYIFWEDYREGGARQWDEVPWVRYKSYLTREELIARFGADKGKKVNLDFSPKHTGQDKADPVLDLLKKAVIWEIWDKSTKKAIWIAPGSPDMILDEQDDPLRLPEFFPNPDPLLATTTTDKRIPTPDYVEYQDQARELDILSERITRLTRAFKVAGVYAATEKQSLQQLIDEGTENRLIPVEDWMSLTDKGGLQGAILWLPIDVMAKVLMGLYDARDKAKQVLYEITGIADIMRGASDPRETATAVRTKGVFGTLRLTKRQKQVANFARSLVRMKAAVIGEHFSAQTISMISGYPLVDPVPPAPQFQPLPLAPPPAIAGLNGQAVPNPEYQHYQQIAGQQAQAMQAYQQQIAPILASNQKKQQEFEAAVALIKQDALHDFRIDIETDSTISMDEDEEQAARTLFLKEMIPMLQTVVPIAQGNPALATLAKEMVLFAARSFKAGRQLEEPLENAFEAIAAMPPKPPAGKSGPEMQLDQQKFAAEQANNQAQLQLEQQRSANDQALEREKMQLQAQNEQIRAQADKDASQAAASFKAQTDQAQIAAESAKAISIARFEAATRVIVAAISAGSSDEAQVGPDGLPMAPTGPNVNAAIAAALQVFVTQEMTPQGMV